ncbi:MAG: chitinase [Lachnospiraceae bacterium]|nr:chitinase [Lachnospiraceae bacterium]
MKIKRIVKGVMMGLCILALTGCGVSNKPESNNDGNKANTTETEKNSDTNSSSSDKLLDSANLLGSVIDFTDTGCTVTQQENIAGGEGAIVAAPGNENQDANVSIQYGSDCVFQIAEISTSTGEATLSDASASDIKKETAIAIYGGFEDSNNLTATKVIITRFK